MENASVFIVIPAYNEIKSIGKAIDALKNRGYHNIIVVDDGSSDGTREFLQSQSIVYAEHLFNRGQGAALRTGTKLAVKLGAEYIVHFDADGQMSVDDIAVLLEPLKNHQVDVVLGSRFLKESRVEGMPKLRRIILLGGKIFNRTFLGINYTDSQAGFRLLNRQAAEKLNWQNDRMAHCSEILQLIKKERLTYVEKPVHIIYTKETLAKGNNTLTAFKIFWDLFINKF